MAINDKMALASQYTVESVSEQAACPLFHLGFIGMRGDTGKVDDSLSRFDDKRDVTGDQVALGPHFRGEEVRGHDGSPARRVKNRPRCAYLAPAPLVALVPEHIGDRSSAHFVPQVRREHLGCACSPIGGLFSAIRTGLIIVVTW